MGADILDVNMGMNGIDEKEMMLQAIEEITLATNLPLCIDSSHVDVIEAALRHYPGRALINSISYEKVKFEALLPLAKKYGGDVYSPSVIGSRPSKKYRRKKRNHSYYFKTC